MSNSLDITSQVVGWIYFVAWSISFYGQCWLNYKLQSVEGFSLKFEVLNITGFCFYSIYNCMSYFGHYDGAGTVDPSDIAFSLHAFFFVLVQGVQCLIYHRGKNTVGWPLWIFNAFLWAFCFIYLILDEGTGTLVPSNPRASALAFFGYGKVLVTFIKYVPQVYWNWKRKSTQGWSIFNVMMDFTGGLFSFIQIIIDDLNGHDVADIFCNGLNIAKFVLSIVSIVFDLIFMFQHYILYNPSKRKNNELADDEPEDLKNALRKYDYSQSNHTQPA